MMRTLRSHQELAMSLLRQSLSTGHRRPMLCAPTGAGKTVIAAAIADGALRKAKRVIICVPALSLIDQTVDAFRQEGIVNIGVMQGYHELTNWAEPVQVCSIQTLQRRSIPEADVVMIDEAHRWYKFYGTWMSDPAWAKKPFIGLSATPWSRGLGKHFDDLLIPTTTKDLIDTGYLSKFRVFAPSHPDLSKVRSTRNSFGEADFHEGDLAEEMGKPQIVADVVNTWLQKGEGRSTLCFAVDRAHAKQLEMAFAQAGVRTAYIDSYTDRQERLKIAADFHSGDVKLVCNVGCLTTGIDWDVRCIILARPTKSEMLFTQIIGRGLRTAEAKDDCLILDHSDTHLRLGFVTDIHHTTLDTGRIKKASERQPKEALPKECSKCTFLKPAKVHVCPACGFTPAKQANVECVDGDLVEMTSKAKPKKKEASSQEKYYFFAQLKGYAKRKGYGNGWASNKFRDKFGVWPNAYSDVDPCEPTPTTMSWIKSRNIAYAKRNGGSNARAA